MTKKAKKIIISSSFFISILFLIAGNYFYDQGVKRGTDVELHSESDNLNSITSEKNQELMKEADSWFEETTLIEYTLPSKDGLVLKADYVEHPTPSSKAVILFHGFRQTRHDMGKYAKMYADAGYNVLLPDARGHGESEGAYIGFGWHDRLDVMEWVDYLVNENDIETIALHGHSMGAATVLMASGETLPAQVKALIADSSYSTVKEELAHQLKHIYRLPSFPLLEVTSLVTKVRANWTFEEADVLNQIKKNDRPLLLIHGDTDDLVPTIMSEKLFTAANGEKELWIVPETGHTKAFENHTAEFTERIIRFLDENTTP